MDSYFRKKHYQDSEVARTYDDRKISTAAKKRDYKATHRALESILRLAEPGASLLDCPAGTGRLAELIMRRRIAYFGADISMEMLQIAREKMGAVGDDLPLLRSDATLLPFGDHQFDFVLCFKFISLLPVEIRLLVLREISRVCGKFLVIQSKHLRTFDPWRECKRGLAKLTGKAGRLHKYQERDELPHFIEQAVAENGLTPMGKIRIVTSPLRWLWPFHFEYLYVFRRTSNSA